MNTRITWTNFDGTSFQALCNLLLLLEVSPNVRGYNAQGKDRGYDAEYQGDYHQQNGKWRFQAKLHLTDSKTATSSLKSQCREDICKNLTDEDHLVYLTNVPLSKQKQDEILIEVRREGMQAHGRCPQIDIWDGAHLESLIRKHPIAYHAYWGEGQGILEPFRNAFATKLNANNSSPFNLHHPAVRREKELAQLFAFIKNDQEQLMSIVGPGGHGKTRLAIDFLIDLEAKEPTWRAFALVPKRNINPQAFKPLLQGTTNLIILIDDAHEVDQLSDLIAIAQLGEFGNRIKLLLTSRIAKAQILGARLGYQQQQVGTIALQPLDTQDTALAVMQYFGAGVLPASKIRWIANKSKGVPIMIQALCFAFGANNNLDIFSGEVNLQTVIQGYLSEIIITTSETTGLSMETIRTAIWALSVISPFRNHNHLFQLASVLQIPPGTFRNLLNCLRTNWLLEIHDREMFVWYDEKDKIPDYFDENGQPTNRVLNLAITPDPVAELIVLWKMEDEELLQKVLDWAIVNGSARNVILNIYQSTLIHSTSKAKGKELLLQHLNALKQEAEAGMFYAWTQRFATMSAIQVVEPQLAFAFIDDFIATAIDSSHPIHAALASEKDPKSFPEYYQQQLSSLFANLVTRMESLHQAFDLLPRIGQLYPEKNGFLLAGFAVYSSDFHETENHEPFQRQHLILQCILQIKGDPEFQRELLLVMAPLLLKVRFTEQAGGNELGDSPMVFWNVFLPNHASIVDFRTKLISSLVATYFQHGGITQSEQILDILSKNKSDVYWAKQEVINNGGKPEEFYDPSGEYQILLAFLEKLAARREDLKLKRLLFNKFGALNEMGINQHLRSSLLIYQKHLENFANEWDELSFRIFCQSSRQYPREALVLILLNSKTSEKEIAHGLAIAAKWEKELGIQKVDGVLKIISEAFKCRQFDVAQLYTELYQNYSRLAIRVADEFLYEIRIHHRGPLEYFEKRVNQLLDNHREASLTTICNLYFSLFFARDNGFIASDFDLRLLKRVLMEAYVPARPSANQKASARLSRDWYDILDHLFKNYPDQFRDLYLQYLMVADNETTQHMLGSLAFQISDELYPTFRDYLWNHAPNLDIRSMPNTYGSSIISCLKHREGMTGLLEFVSTQLSLYKTKQATAKDRKSPFFDPWLEKNPETLEPKWPEYFAAADWVMQWDIVTDEYYPEDVWEMFKLWAPHGGKRTEILPWMKLQIKDTSPQQCFKIAMILRASQLCVSDFKKAVDYLRRMMPAKFEAYETGKLKTYDPEWHWGVDNLTWILQYFADNPVHQETGFASFATKVAKEYAFNEK